MRRILLSFALVAATSTQAIAADTMFEDFGDAETRWEYIADGVMGGVSQGGSEILDEDGQSALRLAGTVSTENNGGFIQARRLLPDGLPTGTSGIEMQVKGNGERYYLFIRTKEMMRPWYYYNAGFETGMGWTDVRIDLAEFERSHAHLAAAIDPEEVISLGIVAYGRDHDADLSVRALDLY